MLLLLVEVLEVIIAEVVEGSSLGLVERCGVLDEEDEVDSLLEGVGLIAIVLRTVALIGVVEVIVTIDADLVADPVTPPAVAAPVSPPVAGTPAVAAVVDPAAAAW